MSSAEKCLPSSASASDGETYLTRDQLSPVDEPEADFGVVFVQLDNKENWTEQFQAMTTVRRLAVFHPQVFGDVINVLVSKLVSNLKSLRSNLVKNSMLALSDLSQCLGERMVVHELVPLVLQKIIGDKKFIRDQAIETMDIVVLSCPQCLMPLLESALSKNAKIAAAATDYIQKSIENMGPSLLVNPLRYELFSTIAKLLDGKLAETRNKTKTIYQYVINSYGGVDSFTQSIEDGKVDANVLQKLLSVSVNTTPNTNPL